MSEAQKTIAERLEDALTRAYRMGAASVKAPDLGPRIQAEFAGFTLETIAAIEAQQAQAPGWQDIATAPKDGTNVLLINRKGNIASGLWMDSLSGTGWWLRGGLGPDAFFNDHHGPTHWMPWPAAPQQGAKTAAESCVAGLLNVIAEDTK